MHGLNDKLIRTKRPRGREFDSDNWNESDSYVPRVFSTTPLDSDFTIDSDNYFDSDNGFDSIQTLRLIRTLIRTIILIRTIMLIRF